MDSASLKKAEMGQFGSIYEAGTTARTGKFWKIRVIAEANFSTLTDATRGGDTMTGVALPAGLEIMGKITAFTLATGSVLAYKAPN